MMDLSKFTLDELKSMRNEYREDLAELKNELQTVRAAIINPQHEIINKLKNIRENRYSKSGTDLSSTEEPEPKKRESTTLQLLKAVTKIKIVDISMKPVKNEAGDELYLYTCNAKIDKLHFEIEYESNLPCVKTTNSTTPEVLTKLNIKILRPNLQSKLQKGLDFFQQNPNFFCSAILFLKSLSELCEMRVNIVKKLYEYEKNLNIGISRSTEQHSIIFKSEFDNREFLNLKWNFKWDPRTGLARDTFSAKIIVADDQLLGEIKPLIEKLCSDKFALDCTERDKFDILRKVILATKDADTRNITAMLS